MRNYKTNVCIVFFFVFGFTGLQAQNPKDIDGNVYKTITIGTQVWMAENLKTTKYSNGDLIGTTSPAILDIDSESTPKYQWAYDGNDSIAAIYGRLYTWYAVTDSRNVCPTGWHVPSFQEWKTLTLYLANNGYVGSGKDVGKSMASTSGWKTSEKQGKIGNDQTSNNSSGFTALPSGGRDGYGVSNYLEEGCFWWTTTEYNDSVAYTQFMIYYHDNVFDNKFIKQYGFSVRCLRD